MNAAGVTNQVEVTKKRCRDEKLRCSLAKMRISEQQRGLAGDLVSSPEVNGDIWRRPKTEGPASVTTVRDLARKKREVPTRTLEFGERISGR
jgi:hypothetical protein